MMMPENGKVAPDFELPNQDGMTVKLSDYRGKTVIVFAFQHVGFSACTKQAIGFRDQFAQIESANAVVLGISTDKQADLKAWGAKLDLPYDLLSDVEHGVLEAWGAWDNLTFKERNFNSVSRSFWVIDPDGVVVDGQVRITADESIRRALLAIK